MTDQSGDNPFDPTSIDLEPDSPNLEDVLRLAMRNVSMHLRVSMPCSVVKVRGNQLVDVQPLLQTQYVTQAEPSNLHVIPNVLVSMPMGQDFSIKYPLQVGDTGFCIFADRSLDTWAASNGGIVDPEDGRLHDTMDAMFVPGLVPTAKQTTDTTDDMVLTNGAAQIRLEKTGRFRVSNANQELLDLTDKLVANYLQLVSALQSAVILTPVGPGSFAAVSQTQLLQIQNAATVLRTNLDTLKG